MTGEARKNSKHKACMCSRRLWRGLAKDWLALLADLKDLRGVYASGALRRSLAAQILSSDSSLQQAALKGLRVSRLCLERPSFCLKPNLIGCSMPLHELSSYVLSPDFAL